MLNDVVHLGLLVALLFFFFIVLHIVGHSPEDWKVNAIL